MRLVTNLPWIKDIYGFLYSYAVYQNISYWWNFGFLSGLCMAIQIVTGVLLAMHYVANIDYAFLSVEHIMRDVDFGWLIRYAHANGASFFFICVYTHMFRGMYYNSYLQPRGLLWVIGVAILFLMIGIAFLGYVLPWGQMSFWAATVITNLASAIPVIGGDIVQWLWGGFCVDNATLNRFFSLHYLLPFVLAFLVLLHLIALHDHGSTNPLGLYSSDDKIPFGPYLWVKDFFSSIIFFEVFFIFIFFFPNYLGHPDNYIPANPLVTPAHIVPEWYFLPFFTVLRSIPNKLGGVIMLLSSIFILALLPFIISSDLKDANNVHIKNFLFWFFLNISFLLGWIGGNPAEGIYIYLGVFCTFCYFFYFFLLYFLSIRNKLKNLF